VVLVIDSSSALSALALLDGDGRPLAEDIFESGREADLPRRAAALASPRRLSAIAVALGPGSFTGLRSGVSYGLGLALGLGVPLLGFGSLRLQGARARAPVTALVDAGRGRVYWESGGSGGPRGPAEPGLLPAGVPALGWLRAGTKEAVAGAGIRLLEDGEVDGFALAASRVVKVAPEVGYATLSLQYMHSFSVD
jgi:tRNA threonylcarbamoyladenosine biosynthesis protein TsaB